MHDARSWCASQNRSWKLPASAAAMGTIYTNGIHVVLADLRARGEKVSGAHHGNQARQDPSDLLGKHRPLLHHRQEQEEHPRQDGGQEVRPRRPQARDLQGRQDQVTHWRERAKRARICQYVTSDEHTSELQALMRTSYPVLCSTKKII